MQFLPVDGFTGKFYITIILFFIYFNFIKLILQTIPEKIYIFFPSTIQT